MKRLYVDTFKGRRHLNFQPCDVLPLGELKEYTFKLNKVFKMLFKFYLRFFKEFLKYDEIIINNRCGRYMFWIYIILFLKKLVSNRPKIVIDYRDDMWRQNFHIIKYLNSIKEKILNFILSIVSFFGDLLSLLIISYIYAPSIKLGLWYQSFAKRTTHRNIPFKIVPNVTDKKFTIIKESNIRDSIKQRARHKYIFMVSSLRPVIDWDFLLDVAKVLRRYSNIKIFIAGQGPLEKIIRNKIKKERLEETVELLGFINYDELKYLIKKSLLCIDFRKKDLALLSTDENIIKIQEYLSFNKIVITNWLEKKSKSIYKIKKPQEILKYISSP